MSCAGSRIDLDLQVGKKAGLYRVGERWIIAQPRLVMPEGIAANGATIVAGGIDAGYDVFAGIGESEIPFAGNPFQEHDSGFGTRCDFPKYIVEAVCSAACSVTAAATAFQLEGVVSCRPVDADCNGALSISGQGADGVMQMHAEEGECREHIVWRTVRPVQDFVAGRGVTQPVFQPRNCADNP